MPDKTSAAPSAKKSTPASTGKQQSILGFFVRNGTPSTQRATPKDASSSPCLKETTKSNYMAIKTRPANITPVPSSDAVEPSSSQENANHDKLKVADACLPSPLTPAELIKQAAPAKVGAPSSPVRNVRPSRPLPQDHCPNVIPQAKRSVNYAESSDDDEDPFASMRAAQSRRRNKVRSSIMEDEDEYDGSDKHAENEDGNAS
jgi:DNA mismatch repair protein MSH6